MADKIPFQIEYIPYQKNPRDSREVHGWFRLTLDSKIVPDLSGNELHLPGYLFHPERLLSCCRNIAQNESSSLSFSDNGFELLSFSPESGRVKIRAYNNQSTEIPKRDAINKIIDCYKKVCIDNNFEIDEEFP